MKYCNAKNKIKTGDVIAWSGDGFFGKIVRMMTGSKYSHVGIAFKAHNRIFVIESVEGEGVRMFPLFRLTPFYIITDIGYYTEEMELKMLNHIGDRYSFMGGIKVLFGITPKVDRRFQCAEFVNYILDLHLDGYTPGELVESLKYGGARMIFVDKLSKKDYYLIENNLCGL